MQIQVRDVDFFVADCRTRLPFRFGMTTMTSAPLLTARVRIEAEDGTRAAGFSADLLVPKWFEKDPSKSVEEDRAALVDSARAAGAAWSAQASVETVFEGWWRVYRERVESVPDEASDRLIRGFGVALVERAVLDATCRAAERSFFEALREDLFAFRPAEVLPELEGWSPAASLPDEPSASVRLRHTIGLADPLRASDVSEETADDGLPRTLAENVRRYGLRVFKIKLGGQRAADLERLLRIADVLGEAGAEAPVWTADGNEQFEDAGEVARLFDELDRHADGRRLLAGLQYVEQPLPRARSFAAESSGGIAALAERVPVIIDEADHGIGAFPRALELGYGGVSVKNCKGVFRALLNRGVCDVRGGGAFQSAEDLTNLGLLALQQDLATVAALGLPHVERNGHHYFRGLDHLPPDEVRDALRVHGDLYEALEGGATLRVEAGELALGSLQGVGYGCSVETRVAERMPLDEWCSTGSAR